MMGVMFIDGFSISCNVSLPRVQDRHPCVNSVIYGKLACRTRALASKLGFVDIFKNNNALIADQEAVLEADKQSAGRVDKGRRHALFNF